MRAGRQWWAGIAGTVGFCLVGVAFLPGLIGRQPTPAPTPVERFVEPAAPSVPEPAVAAPGPVAGPAAPIAEPPPRPPGLGTAPILPGQSFDCMISPSETIDIGSSILGVIESIHVDRSDYVEAGQVLARLESSVEEAAVRVARARAERTVELKSTQVSLELGRKRHSRAKDLYKEQSLSLDLREEIETEAKLAALGVEQEQENHRLAKLQLEQAEAALSRRSIVSPVSGFVVERLMSPGEVVDEETILTVAQIDPLRVEVILPTHLFGAVAPGDSFEIVPEAPLDQPRVAQVEVVDRLLDGASGTFGVRLTLPNPGHELPGGLRCQASRMARDDRLARTGSR